MQLDESGIERVLRWAVIERGTADLSDVLGPEVIAPSAPACFAPWGAVVSGRVKLFRRERASAGTRPSSFAVLRRAITPGAVVLVRCATDIGAAFGSNLVLQAASCRAQAVLTDGASRDTSRARRVGIPVGSSHARPTRPAGCPMITIESEEMFGVTWHEGDWLLRDDDGVLRLDADRARRTAEELAAENTTGELASLLTPANGA